jgi:RNA polymerase sigma-70 factor (ECF subfamily)
MDDLKVEPESWVDRHGDGLYRYALLRLRDLDLAADAVQETFLEALRSRASFAGRSSERAWLIGILRHKIVDQMRKTARQAASLNGFSSNGAAGPAFDHRGRWRVGPASWSLNPGRQMETEEFWDVFRRCLARMPRSLADTFLLRELDDMSADEVQQVLGISPANLWKRLHRARSLLRECLEANWFRPQTKSPFP